MDNQFWLAIFLRKSFQKYGTLQKISEWAALANAKNGFPPISLNSVANFLHSIKKRNAGRNVSVFERRCEVVAHSDASSPKSLAAPATSSFAFFNITTVSNATLSVAATSLSAATTTLPAAPASLSATSATLLQL